jgi:hypothetical protein
LRVSSSIVLIGPAEAIPALRERLSSGAELRTFTDAETVEALDHIIRIKPTLVALEHEFSATRDGTAFIDRIKEDPDLQSCEIRVIARDVVVNRVAMRRTKGGQLVDERVRPEDPGGTRRAVRVRIKDGVEVLVDGNTARLVDMSAFGAQVLSAKMLKPNQQVRITFSDGKGSIRSSGYIAWATYEMPKGEAARYRAGIELSGADPKVLAAFAERHKKN